MPASKAAAIAAKKMPSRAASFEREVAIVRGRRLLSTAAAFNDTGVVQIATNVMTITETNIVVDGGKTNVVVEKKEVIIDQKDEAVEYAGGDPNRKSKKP